MTLSQLRSDIERLDRALVQLIEQRSDLVDKVASWKLSHGLPMHDAQQEEVVLLRAKALSKPTLHPVVEALFEAMFKQARGT